MGFDEVSLQTSRDFVKQVVTGWDHFFGPWLAERTDMTWVPGKGSTIGLVADSGPVACGYFESWNGASVVCHVAGEGKNWLNREFLWYYFFYAFEELGVRKLIAPIDSSNTASVRFATHLGFTLEATLKAACPKGDLLLFSMERAECKWLSLKDRNSGKTQSA